MTAQTVAVTNITRGTVVAWRLKLATTFLSRLRGLLFTAGLAEGEGLLISPCWAIHTFGMTYPIAAVFLDQEKRVCRVDDYLPPGRIAVCRSAASVIELPAGQAVKSRVILGDTLEIKEIDGNLAKQVWENAEVI